MNIYKITLEVDSCFFCELNERNGENVERDMDTRKRNPLKHHIASILMGFFFFLLPECLN